MKTLLPFLTITAFAGLMTFPVNLGAGLMLVLTAGLGAITLQDYSCRPRLQLRGRRPVVATITSMPVTAEREAHRLAA
jgi:hypothetical protein